MDTVNTNLEAIFYLVTNGNGGRLTQDQQNNIERLKQNVCGYVHVHCIHTRLAIIGHTCMLLDTSHVEICNSPCIKQTVCKVCIQLVMYESIYELKKRLSPCSVFHNLVCVCVVCGFTALYVSEQYWQYIPIKNNFNLSQPLSINLNNSLDPNLLENVQINFLF